MYKIGSLIVHRHTKEIYEITMVWGFPAHIEASNCAFIKHSQNTYCFINEELFKNFTVLNNSSKAARLLYSNKVTRE